MSVIGIVLSSCNIHDPEHWEAVSVILTQDLILITEDFFSWLLTCRDQDLGVRHRSGVDTLDNLVS